MRKKTQSHPKSRYMYDVAYGCKYISKWLKQFGGMNLPGIIKDSGIFLHIRTQVQGGNFWSAVVTQYLWGVDSRTPVDIEIWGCESPFWEME